MFLFVADLASLAPHPMVV